MKSFNKFVLQQKPSDLFLVLTGNSTYSYSVLDDLKIDKTVKEKIVITGKHIDDKDLAAIYSNARCFFFMSRYEGFGLPVLEAMQCGAPVVTANTTSLPEVVGDAGIMLAPDDEEALCDAMNTMHINTDMRDKFAQLGFERAKQFSWQRCAQEYADIFKTISKNF
jgi:glycosyltransferase involved in cell wall biosynthesis